MSGAVTIAVWVNDHGNALRGNEVTQSLSTATENRHIHGNSGQQRQTSAMRSGTHLFDKTNDSVEARNAKCLEHVLEHLEDLVARRQQLDGVLDPCADVLANISDAVHRLRTETTHF